jgi:hypothetical protein
MGHTRGFTGNTKTCDVTNIWKSQVFNKDKSIETLPGNKRDRGCDGKDKERDLPNKRARNINPLCVIVFGNKLLKMPNVDDYLDGEKPLCPPHSLKWFKGLQESRL